MGIMDIIKNFIEKRKIKSEKFKKLDEDYRLNKMLEERQKSSNRRELEKYYHDKEEEEIKEKLTEIRKQRNKEVWKDNSILKGQTNILKQDKNILEDNKTLFNSNNIFMDNKNKVPLQNKREGMFFRW